MESYTILREIGKGAYGTVYEASHNQSKQLVAIKQIHQATEEKVGSKNLIELRSFMKIKNHPNLVRLFEVFKDSQGHLCFVFEFINSGSLYDYLVKCQKMNVRISEVELKSLLFFFLHGINHIHNANFIHRDLKLENVLMQAPKNDEEELYASHLSQSSKPLMLKVADLGCAKETRQRFVQNTVYTGTRWYRSIEMLLRDQTYGKPNDIWAIGCIAAELILFRPLFPGKSELDQLHMIFQQFGPLCEQEWPEYQTLSLKMNFVSTVPMSNTRFVTGASHRRVYERLSALLVGFSSECVDCIAWMLELNPQRRWTAAELLAHPWFRSEIQRTGIQVNGQRSASPINYGGSPSGIDYVKKVEDRADSVPVYKNRGVIGQETGVSMDFPARSVSNTNYRDIKDVKKQMQIDQLEDNNMLNGLDDL